MGFEGWGGCGGSRREVAAAVEEGDPRRSQKYGFPCPCFRKNRNRWYHVRLTLSFKSRFV